MINVFINDKICQFDPNQSLQELLIQNNYFEQHVAVALNYQFVAHNAYSKTKLNAGDRVDIIEPMQGG